MSGTNERDIINSASNANIAPRYRVQFIKQITDPTILKTWADSTTFPPRLRETARERLAELEPEVK